MNAPSRHISTRLEPVEPWPVSILPDTSNGVRMSDGSLRFFRSYGRAQAFIEGHPGPTAREQLDASLLEPPPSELMQRTDYHFEEADADRQFGREEDDSWHWNRETEESEID